MIRRRKTAKDRALKHFDEFYKTVYKKSWNDIREALLREEHKYMAVVNSFSDIDRIKSELEVCQCYKILNILCLMKLYNIIILAARRNESKSNI